MERIAKLAEMMRDEVSGARCYAMEALKAKDAGRASEARTFAEMANQELGHSDKLHAVAVNLINDTAQSKDAPEGMRLVWEYEHGRLIDETASVRGLLQMYNG